jgi:UDP-N-acetylglucosamine 1-carboxyvinyltransferase
VKLFVRDKAILNGSVSVSGAKNSATRVLAASLLSDGHVTLRNFPLELEDVKAKLAFIRSMGAKVEAYPETEELRITGGDISFEQISNFDLPIRTTYLLAGGVLARNGHAKVPYPGGCKIGSRGYDLHIMVWQALGCDVEELPDYISVSGKLKGGVIDFPISTVGGTENALICAAVASGDTQIRNAYVTPEVHDLIAFLREMGAQIELVGSSLINVSGRGGPLGSASFSIMSDRIEALTWIVLGAVNGGRLTIRNVPFETMQVPLIHLRDAGLDFLSNDNAVQIGPECIGPHGLQPFELATGTHPGVISDMQSFFVFLALFANGRSIVHDYRYPERIAYVNELAKFAPSSLVAEHGKITIRGPVNLNAAQVKSTDLRGSMAQIMAALCAAGSSHVDGVEMALRGYNRLPEKLAALGAQAEWID